MALISLIFVTPMATSSSGLLGKAPDLIAQQKKLRRAVLQEGPSALVDAGDRWRPSECIIDLRTETPPRTEEYGAAEL
jgi:hypothetical protein